MRQSTLPLLIQSLALEIKVRRKELGLSQEDLAGRMQIDRPYISLIEVGRKQPTLSVLYRLSVGLDLTLAELMARVEGRYRSMPNSGTHVDAVIPSQDAQADTRGVERSEAVQT